MDTYGLMAWQHWQNHRQQELAQIQDPETFFTELGMRVQMRIGELMQEIYQAMPPEDDYQKRIGQHNQARQNAEEHVLEELVFSPRPPQTTGE